MPAQKTPSTVTRLEKDDALIPERPRPEVQPPTSVAPITIVKPPMNACHHGMWNLVKSLPSEGNALDSTSDNIMLPESTPKAKATDV